MRFTEFSSCVLSTFGGATTHAEDDTHAKVASMATRGEDLMHRAFVMSGKQAGNKASGRNAVQPATRLARGLALERAPVRVNAVSPGIIETPLWSGMSEDKRIAMFAGAAQRLPVGRVGQPDDIARAVLFLATTPFATGSTVRVDGGGAIA